MFDGFGEYYWSDGRIYVGYWSENKMNGIGEFHHRDGSIYQGAFLNDQKHGNG